MNATRTSIPLRKGEQLCMAIFGKRALFLWEVGRTRDKRRKPRREAEWFPAYRALICKHGNHFTFLL